MLTGNSQFSGCYVCYERVRREYPLTWIGTPPPTTFFKTTQPGNKKKKHTHVNKTCTQHEIRTAQKTQHDVGVLGAVLEALRRSPL